MNWSLQQYLLMSGHIKTFQLVYQTKPTPLPVRAKRPQAHKSFLRELNALKIFTRMGKTNSISLKGSNETQASNPKKQEQRFIVISRFKNATTTVVPIDTLTNGFKLNRQRLKTFATESIRPVRSSEKSIKNRLQVISKSAKSTEKITKMNLPLQCQQKSQILISKKNLTEHHSHNKSKHEINQQLQKRIVDIRQIRKHSKPITQPTQKKHPILDKEALALKNMKAESYILVELQSERTVVSHRANFAVEIASLTKIMTFYTVLRVSADKGIDVKSASVRVSAYAEHVVGTAAGLLQGEEYTIQQLLYGLMLPSGNDAANELANWAGSLLLDKEKGYKLCRTAFIDEMNKQARMMGLKNTQFGNPHGLPHQGARSTAADMAKLCCKCMKIPLFRRIVSCRSYKLAVKSDKGTRLIEWRNTNKLLRRQGFIGLKTGITVTAGPCLAAAYNFKDKTFISIVLRAPKVSSRFKQTRQLLYSTLSKLFPSLTDRQYSQLQSLRQQNSELDSDNSEEEQEFIYGKLSQAQHRRRCNILDYQL